MKKNIMMRLASGLLVATLLSTCVISGTFAKYVTSGSATDKARVAKWGVKVETATDSMFAKDYATTDDAAIAASIEYSVSSSDGDKVVAPGTSGSIAAFTVTGTPEVAVRIAAEATKFEVTNWEVDNTFYCPIVITVGTTPVAGTNYYSADDFQTAVKNTIAAYTKDVGPKVDLSADDDKLTITWAWAFETGTDEATKAANDIKDTALGEKALTENAPKIEINVTLTVTQID